MSYNIGQYIGSEFSGKPLLADVDFFPALDRINSYAKIANVTVYITSSYRDYVIQVSNDNHQIGHAIDFNLIINKNGHLCNSTCLMTDPDSKVFLDMIRNDDELRYGGDFNTPDPVHIDDGYNQDKVAWEIKHNGGNTGTSTPDTEITYTNDVVVETSDVGNLTKKNKRNFFLPVSELQDY